MKSIALIIFFKVSAISCIGQSMFFYDLNISTWTSASDISDSVLKYSKQISLSKLIYSKDSIKKDVTIWTFRDSVLTIAKYDCHKKTESIVGTYMYEVLQNKSIFQIRLPENNVLKYKVGIVSTGYYSVLIRTSDKKDRK